MQLLKTRTKKNEKVMKTKYVLTLATIAAATLSPISLYAARSADQRIVAAAKHSYVYRTYLKDDDIKIKARDGVVTLSGDVPDRSHKSMAEDTVENLPGVKSVENQLETKPSKPPEKSDRLIEFQVRSALLYHRSVSGIRTTVSAQDGLVTLTGVATSQAQRELTTEYAKDIEGVKEVKNEMIVSETPPARTFSEVVDDASITAQVKSALLTHRSTSSLKTRVATREGVVSLSGEAKNQAEKDLVTKLATDIHGVKDVANNMTVKE